MKVKFLIHIAKQNDQLWVAKCPALSKASILCQNREDALKDMRNQLAQYLQPEGQSYLSAWKGTSEIISCPEGYVELPIDIWKCKLNRKTCPIQGRVFITDKAKFLYGCHAPRERKEAIFTAIEDSRYNGFHHMPGRYLCPLCRGKQYRYHYPWELTLLIGFFDIYDRDFRIRLIREGINLAATTSALCPKCFITVVSKMDPNLEKGLEILELDFFR